MPDDDVLELVNTCATTRLRLSQVTAALHSLLPAACVEHVGSTAVPGCLSKGDLDVLVRVTRGAFPGSRALLDGALERSRRNEPTSEYVEYDWDQVGGVSIQLVVKGCWHDRRFRAWRDALLADPVLLDRYNRLKLRCEGRALAEYEAAKGALIDSVL